MSSKKQETEKGKAGRKKLTLSKETLKDLTAPNAPIKGGARTLPGDGTRNTCSCDNNCS